MDKVRPQGPPEIFDRPLLRARKARAAHGFEKTTFLLDHVAADFSERLTLVNRQFAVGLDLGAHGKQLADALGRTGKVGRMLRAPIVPELAGPSDGNLVSGDEDTLGAAPASLDLVVSALGLHLVNDLPGTLAQIRRALKPDGLFLAALLAGRSLEQLRSAFASAEISLSGGLSPRVAPFADVRDLGGLLQRAGFALPVADSEVLTATYADPLALMVELKAMGASNMLTDRRRTVLRRDLLAAAVEAYRRGYGLPDGRVAATFEIVTLTGWAPDASQQQPLRPGSARASLSQAVRAVEGSAQSGDEDVGDIAQHRR